MKPFDAGKQRALAGKAIKLKTWNAYASNRDRVAHWVGWVQGTSMSQQVKGGRHADK